LLHAGLTCPAIARRLGITERTVRRHVQDIAQEIRGEQPPIRRIVQNARELLEAS
jgi:predicted transcriptional regulator